MSASVSSSTRHTRASILYGGDGIVGEDYAPRQAVHGPAHLFAEGLSSQRK
jgi:hypothetical protein